MCVFQECSNIFSKGGGEELAKLTGSVFLGNVLIGQHFWLVLFHYSPLDGAHQLIVCLNEFKYRIDLILLYLSVNIVGSKSQPEKAKFLYKKLN